jgi:hypothetical protein
MVRRRRERRRRRFVAPSPGTTLSHLVKICPTFQIDLFTALGVERKLYLEMYNYMSKIVQKGVKESNTF